MFLPSSNARLRVALPVTHAMTRRHLLPGIRAAIAIALLAGATGVLAQGANSGMLIQFDAPGASNATSLGTFGQAINDVGAVAGYYVDANVVPHGFVREPGGKVTSFDAPGAGLGAGLNQGTVAYAINVTGEIAGQFQDSSYAYHGFIRRPSGSFITFDAPGASTSPGLGTFAFDINSRGGTAGVFYDATGLLHGFIRSPQGHITPVDAPDASPSSYGTYVCQETCLNASGTVTGFYYDAASALHGFIRSPNGNIQEFDAPLAGNGAFEGTIAASINDEGVVTGYVVDTNNLAYGFTRSPDGHFKVFNAPGAAVIPGEGTISFAINDLNAVTGDAYDANNVMHGFERLFGHFLTFDAPGAGNGSGQGTRVSANNIEGVVTGWYVAPNGSNHGFVWIP